MGRKKKLQPRYLEHKQSGRGRALYYDALGQFHEVLLPGAFNSPESTAAYGRLLLDLAVAPKGASVPAAERSHLTLVEILDQFHEYAQRKYRDPDGKPTSKLPEYRLVIRRLRELYGATPAAEFGPLKLKAFRQSWVVDGLSRGECNRRTDEARRIVRWAVSEELVPATVLTALKAVKCLERGETAARETEPVEPVAEEVVDATLPHLSRTVAAMVQFQRLTGCRPGEACSLRMSEVDRSGEVWLFKPKRHKTAHKGRARVIAIGPKAQEVLAPFLAGDPQEYLFSPAATVAEHNAARSAARKTKYYPSHLKHNARRKVKRPKRTAAARYSTHAYSVAIDRACDRAFPPPAELAPRKGESVKAWKARLTPGEAERVKEWQREHRWHPNQLRHSFATAVRKAHGLEAAQVLLGHSRADVTQVYAERDARLAVEIAAKVG